MLHTMFCLIACTLVYLPGNGVQADSWDRATSISMAQLRGHIMGHGGFGFWIMAGGWWK